VASLGGEGDKTSASPATPGTRVGWPFPVKVPGVRSPRRLADGLKSNRTKNQSGQTVVA